MPKTDNYRKLKNAEFPDCCMSCTHVLPDCDWWWCEHDDVNDDSTRVELDCVCDKFERGANWK